MEDPDKAHERLGDQASAAADYERLLMEAGSLASALSEAREEARATASRACWWT